MNIKKQIRILLFIGLVLTFLATPLFAKSAKIVRVGISEYQNIEDVYDKYRSLFQELTDAAIDEPVTFNFAIGTPAEVIDWYNRKLIDVAILSPQPLAEMLLTYGKDDVEKLERSYVGSLSSIVGNNTLLQLYEDEFSKKRKDETNDLYFSYLTGLFVPANDPDIRTFDDIKKFAAKDKLKFLFVRTYSVSGYILPKYFLKQQAIDIETSLDDVSGSLKAPHEFTFSHTESLKQLLEYKPDGSGSHLAAFVLDMTDLKTIDYKQFRRIPIEGLDSDEMLIPQQAVIVNYNQENEKSENNKAKNKPEEYKKLMQKLFSKKPKTTRFRYKDFKKEKSIDWLQPYQRVANWLQEANLPKQVPFKSNFDDFIKDLAKFKNTHKPRLALVLSGGGAKCAYQAGAITQIEKRLQELRRDPANNLEDLDIDLVVGTSGGAINTLLTALMITSDEQTVEELHKVWTSFDHSDFFDPPFLVQLLFGLCFGLLQAFVVTLAVILFGQEKILWKPLVMLACVAVLVELICVLYLQLSFNGFVLALIMQITMLVSFALFIRLCRNLLTFLGVKLLGASSLNWWRMAGWIMLVISIVETIIYLMSSSLDMSSVLGESRFLINIWLIIKLSSLFSAPYPFILGVLMILSGWKFFPPIGFQERWVIRWLSFGLIIASVLLLLHVFVGENFVTHPLGIERAMAEKIPAVIVKNLNIRLNSTQHEDERQKLQAAISQIRESEKEPDYQKRLELISQAVIDNQLLKRDLVITTSLLPIKKDEKRETDRKLFVAPEDLPEDLYFYYKSERGTNPPPDKRFIPLRENKTSLLDVVIGSSTIYPFFPSRELKNVKIGNEESFKTVSPSMNVIDGGFIHNSPLEAARDWGATHILLIEASPKRKIPKPGSFFSNIFVAYQYLFFQAQRMDTLSRGSVEIFELRPTSICDNQVVNRPSCEKPPEPNMGTFDFSRSLLENAFKKGVNDIEEGKPLFVRVPGPPLFRDLASYEKIKDKSKP